MWELPDLNFIEADGVEIHRDELPERGHEAEPGAGPYARGRYGSPAQESVQAVWAHEHPTHQSLLGVPEVDVKHPEK